MTSNKLGILSRLLANRGFHSTCARLIDPKNVEEVKIPVPWGHIAGKWWGSRDAQPALAFHGWQDNAGSWDPLAEILPDELSLLALDFPGNGLSSHLPKFMNYYATDSAITIKQVKRYFNFDKLVLLGHSGGSASCFIFSAIFPEDVVGYFGIDYVLYAYKDPKSRVERLGELIDKKIQLALREEKDSRKYTWEEARDNWVKATRGFVSPKSAEILMKRGVKEVGEGLYTFTRDHSLKAADLDQIDVKQATSLARNVSCHVCLMKGKRSHFFDQGLKHFPDALDVIKGSAKSFEFVEVDQGHHLHMDSPECVLPVFLRFLDKL